MFSVNFFQTVGDVTEKPLSLFFQLHNQKVEVCKIAIILWSAPESSVPNDSLKVQSDSIDTDRCHVYSRMKLGFRNVEVLLSGERAIFKNLNMQGDKLLRSF